MDLPTDEEIGELAKTGDPFRYAIIGFSAIESALEALISESLTKPHRLELRRLSFSFKVDLAIGVGGLNHESKGLLIKLAKIRNFYAHDFALREEYCSASELASCMNEIHRQTAAERLTSAETFGDVLGIAFIVAYYELRSNIERVQKRKQQLKDAAAHARAVLTVIKPTLDLSKEVEERKKKLLEEIERVKQEQQRLDDED